MTTTYDLTTVDGRRRLVRDRIISHVANVDMDLYIHADAVDDAAPERFDDLVPGANALDAYRVVSQMPDNEYRAFECNTLACFYGHQLLAYRDAGILDRLAPAGRDSSSVMEHRAANDLDIDRNAFDYSPAAWPAVMVGAYHAAVDKAEVQEDGYISDEDRRLAQSTAIIAYLTHLIGD